MPDSCFKQQYLSLLLCLIIATLLGIGVTIAYPKFSLELGVPWWWWRGEVGKDQTTILLHCGRNPDLKSSLTTTAWTSSGSMIFVCRLPSVFSSPPCSLCWLWLAHAFCTLFPSPSMIIEERQKESQRKTKNQEEQKSGTLLAMPSLSFTHFYSWAYAH